MLAIADPLLTREEQLTIHQRQLGTEEAAEEYTSIQLNKVSELMVHQDRFNQGCNWVISVGTYQGGRIWVEDSHGQYPPPNVPGSTLRGVYYDTRYKWLKFNPKLKHAVEPSTGTRVSLVFFTPQRLGALSDEHWETLLNFGFRQAEQVQDIFARSFSDASMTAEQTRAELQRLQSTISVDLYFRLATFLEVDVTLMPPHPAIDNMDEDVVHVQNKIWTEVPAAVPVVASVSVPVEPVPAKSLPNMPKAPKAPPPKLPPPQLPEDRVQVPVAPKAPPPNLPEDRVPVQVAETTVPLAPPTLVPATPQEAMPDNVRVQESEKTYVNANAERWMATD
eukprot:1425104-Amphidinium_carterae.1